MLVDSHCHLDCLDVAKVGDLDQVLDAARAVDVGHMLCVAIHLEAWPTMMTLIRDRPTIFASVGVHPNEREGHDPSVAELVRLASDPQVVAIGETGLDYFRNSGDMAWQQARFRRHIAAAKETGKPLIVHCREAKHDVLRLLREEGADQVGGVMHCFAEDWETAVGAMALGFYISFSGIVTFNSAQTLREVAARMPLERLLVETDSPYLAPVPHRGKTNQPAYTRHVAERVAEVRGVSYAEIAAASTQNFFTLFRAATP